MKTIHQGDLIAQPGVVYDLVEIAGGLDARGADTRTAFPRLATVGGWLDAPADAAPIVRSTDDMAAVQRALARRRLTLDDGILCHVIARRGAVTRVRRVGLPPTAPASYLVTDGTLTAHGATLREARADLRLKQTGADTTPYRGWTLATVVSQEDAILAYRAITGACGQGVRDWLAQRRVPARISIQQIVDLTHGQYGAAQFKAFFADRSAA